MADPPVAGVTNATEIGGLRWVRVGIAGALGTVAGTADAEAFDAVPLPTAFVANTVQVYVLPFVSDATTIGEPPPVFDPAAPPSLDVQLTVYPVMRDPPLAAATNATEIEPMPRVRVGTAGVPGTVAGTAVAEVDDGCPSPTAFVANTSQV